VPASVPRTDAGVPVEVADWVIAAEYVPRRCHLELNQIVA
jgi:hypothetical protein